MEYYIRASEKRIENFAKDFKEDIGPFTKTAILSELKTMYMVGNKAKMPSFDEVEEIYMRMDDVGDLPNDTSGRLKAFYEIISRMIVK